MLASTSVTSASSTTVAKETVGSKLKKCALCEFSSDSRDKFLSHIRIHKPIIKRGDMASVPLGDNEGQTAALNFNEVSDCLQCKECGMCFASEASWKKHLFLLHRIKKPQPDDYCDDLVLAASASSPPPPPSTAPLAETVLSPAAPPVATIPDETHSMI